jgi:catechol 2,3-dioxygenase-like lactoylglutathione lyase family enzyme
VQQVGSRSGAATPDTTNYQLSNEEKITVIKAIRSLDYVIIICRDIEVMKQFYRDQLKFSLCRDLGDWVEFQIGTVLLTLRTRGTGYEGMREYDGQAGKGALCQFAFRVLLAEVDSCFGELRDNGVEIIQAPVNQLRTGHRTLFFKDPENNILEIYAEV